MERELIGTVGIAVVISMVASGLILPFGDRDPIQVLKNEYPEWLELALSDSVGENAFTFGFAVTSRQVNVQVSIAFLYGHNLTGMDATALNQTLDAIEIYQKLVPEDLQCITTGRTMYNGTEAEYSLYDFSRPDNVIADDAQTVFLLIGHDSEYIGCFTGVADLFPGRGSGSLIDAVVTRSGNRTYFSRRSLEEAGALPIGDLPSGVFEFEGVEADETVEISYQSDASFTKPQRTGAVQVIAVLCNGIVETMTFNFLK